MNETTVANHFKTVFSHYRIWSISSDRELGWPDVMMQLAGSVAIMVEFKLLTVNGHNEINFASFRQDQAVWLAKWTSAGGVGLLFNGIKRQGNGQFLGYSFVNCRNWKEWLQVTDRKVNVDDINILNDSDEIRDAFERLLLHNNVNVKALKPVDRRNVAFVG